MGVYETPLLEAYKTSSEHEWLWITLGAMNSYALSLVVKSMQMHVSGYIHLALCSFLLVRCPKGSYYDSLQEKCIRCSAGSYQSQEGRFECLPCPDGTWTIGNDTGNFTSCQGTNSFLLMTTVTKAIFCGKSCLSHQFSINTYYDSVSKKGPTEFLRYHSFN